MKAALVCAAVLLCGCTTQKTIYLPDGRQGYSINCSGAANSWEQCFTKAGEICKANGYETVTKAGDQGATFSATQYGAFGGSVMNRVMLIACK